MNIIKAATGTRVIYYPGNFFLPDTTRIPELEKPPHMSTQHLFNKNCHFQF